MSQGGGFYTNANSSPYSQNSSPGGMDATKRSELSHSIRPLTIALLHKATQAHADAEWTVLSREIGQVTVVAQVLTMTRQATNTLYMLDDGTGSMEVRHWNEQSNEEDEAKWGHIQESQYVRATGNLKSFGNKKYINATSLRATDDDHELFFHLLETINVTMIQAKGPPGTQPGVASGKVNGGTSASAYTAQSSGGGVDEMAEYASLPPLQRQIISTILSRPEQEAGGVHVAIIAKAIGGGQDMAAKISGALDALMDAGHIFNTTDDSHFQVSR